MDYWHNILIEKSWDLLKEFKGKFNFTLIGGWAVYLWSNAHKSKDIDIVVDFKTLNKLKKSFDLRKNPNLKKYGIKVEEIDIDVYVPFYSELAIPLEELKKEKIQGFEVASVEQLLILKQGAEKERSFSEKGEKDRIDILDLLINCDINFEEYFRLLKKHKKEDFYKRLISLVKNFKEYKYFNMTPRQFKIIKKEILNKIKSF